MDWATIWAIFLPTHLVTLATIHMFLQWLERCSHKMVVKKQFSLYACNLFLLSDNAEPIVICKYVNYNNSKSIVLN
jgi:hypothetical protein